MKIVNSPTAGWRTLRKLSVAAACVGLLTVSGPAVANASLTPALSKPTVVSFKAAPSHLSAAGGTVVLTAKVQGATTCTFGGHGTVTVSCSGGSAKVKDKIAANGSVKSKTLHLTLLVKGKGGTAPKRSIKVTEAGKPATPTTTVAPTSTTSANSATTCVGPCTFTFSAGPDYNGFVSVELNNVTQGVQCPNSQNGGCAATSAQQIDQANITMCAGGGGVNAVKNALTNFTLTAASGATASLDPVSSSATVSTAFGNFSTLAANLCDTGNLWFDLTANTQWNTLTFKYTADANFSDIVLYSWNAT
ncbi:MAG TPA: hypothetical protein VMS00_03085 [Acidimicrobiales bacterium]|nr:hypothetical protein [Acidimicrobiales bacterium]